MQTNILRRLLGAGSGAAIAGLLLSQPAAAGVSPTLPSILNNIAIAAPNRKDFQVAQLVLQPSENPNIVLVGRGHSSHSSHRSHSSHHSGSSGMGRSYSGRSDAGYAYGIGGITPPPVDPQPGKQSKENSKQDKAKAIKDKKSTNKHEPPAIVSKYKVQKIYHGLNQIARASILNTETHKEYDVMEFDGIDDLIVIKIDESTRGIQVFDSHGSSTFLKEE